MIASTLSAVSFGGLVGTDAANSSDSFVQLRDSLVFNLPNATAVDIGTFVNGSVLAVNARVTGSGHLEGQLIADSLYGKTNPWNPGSLIKLELGYEPFRPTTAIPEPQSWALFLGGFAVMGLVARRRRRVH